ncbi:DUF7260 family protein [Haladaptatus sp. DFWS20]|uniref:DUF7260 family protein n=1 Tax=Haladaptatus sp. DFWS20 TaxID=3403467 RepID=UPI003EB83148
MAQKGNRIIDRTPLPRAQRILDREESQVQAEINAFEDFHDRLGENPPQPYRADGGTRSKLLSSQTSPSASQKPVQTAYRETVLAVEHWEAEYSEETALESIADEFGHNVAAGIAGGPSTCSSLLWNQLLSETENAIETRTRSNQLITAERQQLAELEGSLADIGEELAAIERANHSFANRSDRLSEIQEQLDQLADDQQSYLRQRQRSNSDLFLSYLYADLEADYPGLAAIARTKEVRDTIEVRHWSGQI